MTRLVDAPAVVDAAVSQFSDGPAKPVGEGAKPLRADARRNREKLLSAAAEAFTAHGVEVSLEEIARQAEVGIGTLYRNFPTREALVLAVYQQQIEDLDVLSRTLLDEHPPLEALRIWMSAFTDYVAVKRGLINLLKVMIEADGQLLDGARETLRSAADRLLAAAKETDGITSDISGGDLVRTLSGVCMTSSAGAVPTSVIELIFDGLRYRAAGN